MWTTPAKLGTATSDLLALRRVLTSDLLALIRPEGFLRRLKTPEDPDSRADLVFRSRHRGVAQAANALAEAIREEGMPAPSDPTDPTS